MMNQNRLKFLLQLIVIMLSIPLLTLAITLIKVEKRVTKLEQQIFQKEEIKQSSYSVSNEEFSPYLIGIFERGI